jgi:hypothetical protein
MKYLRSYRDYLNESSQYQRSGLNRSSHLKSKNFIKEFRNFKNSNRLFEEDDSWKERHHFIISDLHGETSPGQKMMGDQIKLIGGPGGEQMHITGWEDARSESERLVANLKRNKTGRIICIGKGCEYLGNIAKHISNKSNIWVVEPSGKINIPDGIPKNQVILGPTPNRGSENFEEGNIKTPEGTDHWGALTYAGKLIGIYSDKLISDEFKYAAGSLDPAYYKYEKSPITGDIGEIQQFMIDMGTKSVDGNGGTSYLTKDGSFGEDTATAIAIYLYGTESLPKDDLKNPQKITVSELQKRLGIGVDGQAGKETLDAIAKKFNDIVKSKIGKEDSEAANNSWNSNGKSTTYGETIKNVMNGNTAPYEGTFQARQTFYRQIHELLYAKPNAEAKAAIESFNLKPIHSNWFQAAAAVNQANALGAADNWNLWIISDETEEMLRYCGVELLKRNIVTAKEMLLGTLNKSFTSAKGKTIKLDKSVQGQTLDNRLVEYEQSELNGIMSGYRSKTGPDNWKSMIDGINASFGLPAAPSLISNVIKKFFGPKAAAGAGILDFFFSANSPAYKLVSNTISGIANYFDHTFNIDNYDNRATLGKGCVAQLYNGEGSLSGMNLI